MQIDFRQKQAIEHHLGPMLVLAGPGSGKTTVITRRVQWLIKQAGVSPGNILVVTFTRAAAMEMRDRFDRLMQGKHLGVSFGTFHSVFFSILKYTYHYTVENILNDNEKYEILRQIVHQIDPEMDDEKDFLMQIASEIGKIKDELIPIENYYPSSCAKEVFDQIFINYHRKLDRLRRIDYDDMMVQTYNLFKKHPEILSLWQKKFRYVLIDEFQDINRLQYEIIRMLVESERNLCVVGDDDQSIYRFRGAKPEILLGFPKDYPDAKQIILNHNYRSSESIVKRANALIQHNHYRYEKDLCAHRTSGTDVCVKAFDKPSDQYLKMIGELVESQKKEDIPWNQFAIIFRTNTQMSGFMEQLMMHNIPFVMKDHIPNIYDHWISKDIFAYMNLAFGEHRRSDYLRIINRPNRYISRTYFEHEYMQLDELKKHYETKEWMLERIEQLEYDLFMLAEMAPYPAIQYIRHAIGYDEYLKSYAQRQGIKSESLLEILDELMDHSHAYATWEKWFMAIERYSEYLNRQSKEMFERTEGVHLLTMHGAKGLEYDIVYIPDANQGITPHKKAMTQDELEEERRMFYVAMTRAKNMLRIYFCRHMYGKPSEISPFIGEFLAI